jgi:hypothetical protein
MTTFKEIRGNLIKSTSTDPANPQEGQIWYNSTSQVLKGEEILGAWSSGGSLGTARNGLGTAGIQTAGLGFGGYNATPVQVTDTEEYNGSGWTTGGALNTARGQLTGFGTQTSAVAAGGSLVAGSPSPAASPVYTNIAEEYNGTSWTTIPSMTTGRFLLASAGIQTAGMAVGGRVSDTTFTNATEEYNGASWTAGGSMNTPAPLSSAIGGCGTLTAGLKFGGPAPTTNTEEYNGTSWTEVSNLNTGRERIAGAGIQTAGLAIGGNPNIASTESYDGTSWTAVADLGTGRNDISATGASNTSALAFGGNLPPKTGATEEFSFAPATRTFTTS